MRWPLACLLLASCGGSSDQIIRDAVAQTPIAGEHNYTQTEWIQYRNAGQGITNLSGNPCGFPGIALTSSLNVIYLQWMKPVKYARWVLVYTPRGGSVRLIDADFGPSNIVDIEVASAAAATPIVHAADITAHVNARIASGAPYKQFGFQICGPAIVYSSVIEVVQ